MRQAAEAAVHVGFPRVRYGADDVFPLAAELGEFFKAVFTGKPRTLLLIEPSKKFVYILPDAVTVKDFEHNVIAHGHGDAGIEKVARVNNHRFAPALGLKGAQGREHVID